MTTILPYMRQWFGIYKSYFPEVLIPEFYYRIVSKVALCEVQRERKLPIPAPGKALRRLGSRPLLMIHGGQDKYIKPEMARTLFGLSKAAPEDREFWLVEGAKHNQALHVAGAEYHERVLGFFERHLATQKPTPLVEGGIAFAAARVARPRVEPPARQGQPLISSDETTPWREAFKMARARTCCARSCYGRSPSRPAPTGPLRGHDARPPAQSRKPSCATSSTRRPAPASAATTTSPPSRTVRRLSAATSRSPATRRSSLTWRACARARRRRFLSDPHVYMFALTSGTTATRKFIPVTKRYLDDYKRSWNLWGLKVFRDHREVSLRPIVQMAGDRRRVSHRVGRAVRRGHRPDRDDAEAHHPLAVLRARGGRPASRTRRRNTTPSCA